MINNLDKARAQKIVTALNETKQKLALIRSCPNYLEDENNRHSRILEEPSFYFATNSRHVDPLVLDNIQETVDWFSGIQEGDKGEDYSEIPGVLDTRDIPGIPGIEEEILDLMNNTLSGDIDGLEYMGRWVDLEHILYDKVYPDDLDNEGLIK